VPVFSEDLDDVRGFVHAKDLLTLGPDQWEVPLPAEMIRPLLIVPESAGVDVLLEDMRRSRNHLALVVDEHGGTAGIITMEDIVEEVVGEIRDEHDTESDRVERIAAGRFVVDAALRPSEVRKETGIDVPDGEYDTVSGLIMDRLQRVPRVGDLLSEPGWSLRVRKMDGRSVDEVDLIAKRNRQEPLD
jgi:CBS domain containing-hemolysin-like protein